MANFKSGFVNIIGFPNAGKSTLINHLVKERGMTLKGAKAKIKENRTETENTYEIVQKLQQIKSYLLEIKDSL